MLPFQPPTTFAVGAVSKNKTTRAPSTFVAQVIVWNSDVILKYFHDPEQQENTMPILPFSLES
jgi:hypothetical protein